MKKIMMAVFTTVLALNVVAEDKEKKPKAETPHSKMVASLKLTDEQKLQFRALQKEQGKFTAAQKKRSADEKQAAGKVFYKERQAKLKKLFTAEQMKIWNQYQAKRRAERQKKGN